tara:strand:- start:813 stop:1625 length:813 start_codon:yes stop_codon:yes gene_type:complete
MIKFYKTVNNQIHYWETWDNEGQFATVHWGIVGQTGDNKTVHSSLFKNYKKKVQEEIDKRITEGYMNFDNMDIVFLEVVYQIEGMGTGEDLEKRHELENRLNELLGWAGLGHVGGGSIGSGTMEVGCEVVNYEIAYNLIQHDLKDTKFQDYLEIRALDYQTPNIASLEELLIDIPHEVINIHVIEPENIDERISAVGIIYANTIGVKEASIEFIPNDTPPSNEEVLSWIWTFRPDLGTQILTHQINPEFKKLIESYTGGKMSEFWDYMSQ